MPSIWEQAIQDGREARQRGEQRDPTPYLERYGDKKGLRTPAELWEFGWDEEDARLACGVGTAPAAG